jgi:ATP-binding cassette subfamily B multidrug efflux pump
VAVETRGVAYRGNRLLYYLWWYRRRYALGLTALILASVFVLLPPFVVERAIDAIDESVRGERVPPVSGGQLALFGAIILVIAVAESVMRYASRHLVSGTARRIEYSIREELADHLLRLDPKFYVESRTGDVMARCTNDLQWVRDFIGPSLVDAVRTVVMIVLGLIVLLTTDLRLGLISVAYLPLAAGGVAYFEQAVEKKYMRVQEQFGDLSNRVQENISGQRAIKAHAQEESEISAFRRANQEMMSRAMSLATYLAILFPLSIVATGASIALVLWFGGHDVVSGRISIGDFVKFMAVLTLLSNQLSSIGWSLAALQQGIVATRRINEVLHTEPAMLDPAQPRAIERFRGEIEYRNVTVSYGGEPVLSGVHLHIPAGTTVAFVGGTGSGKTTLANLLVRLVDPEQGQVLIDGVDVREITLERLREAIGFVPQESFLFSDSLHDNVAFGRPDAPAEVVQHAVRTSQLSNDLEQFPHGLETVIGERGVTLSGGQKQRAALARALVKDPPVLVLDDALSHVDTHTEEEILRRLRDFMAQRTTVVIAHRTSTFKSADRIVVLDGGTVAESGTHEELLGRQGVYARIYREQRLTELREQDVESELIERLPNGYDGAAGRDGGHA